MRTALVLEGGAMKGMYTAGVLDLFMDHDIKFDGIIGVSAGALFGVNYLSKQKGRAIRYNKRYNGDPNYMGIRPLLKTGNIIDTHFAYEKVPHELDPFDDETYMKSQVPFYAVVTNIRTAKPEYMQIKSVFQQMDVLRASGSMPFMAKPVEIGGELYLDGAVTDSIPFEHMLELGYDRLVVVLTKVSGYVKGPIPPIMPRLYYKKKYPEFARAVENRHLMYNGQMDRLQKLEGQGKALVIRPSEYVKIGRIEKDPEVMETMYQLGIEDAKKFVDKL